jgi:peptidoglycan/xylan/chitin deacetylase (PgdA/CDA1 family)
MKLSVLIAPGPRQETSRRRLEALARRDAEPRFETIALDSLGASFRAAEAPLCLIVEDDAVDGVDAIDAHLRAHEKDAAVVVAPGQVSAPREAALAAWSGGTESAIELSAALCERGLAPRYLFGEDTLPASSRRMGRQIAQARQQGAAYAELAARTPAARAGLLGWFIDTTSREILLRRALLAVRASPALLAAAGSLVPGAGRRRAWLGFVARLAFWRGARGRMSREVWTRTTHGVPVLMYHAFDQGEEADRYVVSARKLRRQLRLLSLLRYRVVPFEEVARALAASELPPPRAVAITVDDGYRDNLEVALPILRRRGLTATVFLVSKRLGGVNDWTAEGALAKRPLISPEQARALAEEGISLGAHTRAHPRLPDLPDNEVEAEIAGSKSDLEDLLAAPVTTFAYPFGRFDERAAVAAKQAGFVGACTVEPRRARLDDDPHRVPRIEARAGDSLPRFAVKLWFGGR